MSEVEVQDTDIPGLVLLRHAVQTGDEGWFKENWHALKFEAAGVGFAPMQHNVSQTATRGMTRGFHAEPWDRVVSVLNGRVFGAWVDLRAGESFGRVVTAELDASTSVFVPEGVGNSHQVLQDNTILSYLMSANWTPDAKQRSVQVNLFDPELAVPWPLPADDARVTAVDAALPLLAEVRGRVLPGGSEGVAGDVEAVGVDEFDADEETQSMADALARSAPPRPYRVLFVCTANICRSAYADVVARNLGLEGVEFSSAGVRALVGETIDPPMGRHVRGREGIDSHLARQLTRDLMEQSDLVITMAADHRRYILDEWPSLGRKAFVIGHVAREIGSAPADGGLAGLVDHLWRHRTVEHGDEVADPYRRGEAAAATAASEINEHLGRIVEGLDRLRG